MVRRRGSGKSEQGVVLFMVLVIALLLLSVGAVLGFHLQKRMDIFRDQQRNLHVQALLDSGMASALASLRDNHLYQGKQELELDGGEVEVVVSYGSGTGLRKVEITSKFRHETRRSEGVIRAEQNQLPRVIEWTPVGAQDADDSP